MYPLHAGMLRPRGHMDLEAKSFGLGLTLSGLGLDLGGNAEIARLDIECVSSKLNLNYLLAAKNRTSKNTATGTQRSSAAYNHL